MSIESEAALFLWDLLDDIDTCGDIARADDKLYREMVEKLQRKRFEVGEVDDAGQTVTFKQRVALAASIREK